jgi:hypothetical protein
MYIFYGWLFHLNMYNKSKSMCSVQENSSSTRQPKSQKNNAADSTRGRWCCI